MPIGVTLGGKATVSSNISYLMKGLSGIYFYIFEGYYVYVTFNRLEPGEKPLTKILLFLSNFADEKYLSLLVCVDTTI